jgi:hypothetical protein
MTFEARLAFVVAHFPHCLCTPTQWGCWLTPVLQWHVPAFRIGVTFDGQFVL